MILRERRDIASAAGSFRKDPLHEVAFLADIALAIRSGSQHDKIGAMMRLSKSIERGAVPKKESSDILCEALTDSDRAVKRNAIIILARLGSDFLPGLCFGLGNDDMQVRSMSAAMVRALVSQDCTAFCRVGPEERKSVSSLFAAMECGEHAVADNAFGALMEIASRTPLLILDNALPATGRRRELEIAALESLRERSAENRC